jgi:hypothetical protein
MLPNTPHWRVSSRLGRQPGLICEDPALQRRVFSFLLQTTACLHQKRETAGDLNELQHYLLQTLIVCSETVQNPA